MYMNFKNNDVWIHRIMIQIQCTLYNEHIKVQICSIIICNTWWWKKIKKNIIENTFIKSIFCKYMYVYFFTYTFILCNMI